MMFDANDTSFVPLLRKIKASEIVRSGSLSQVWLWLLTDAEYYPRTVRVPVGRGVVEIELQLGETFVQTEDLAKYLRMSDDTLRRALYHLRKRESITLEPTRGGYKVKLVNAGEYWNRRGAESERSAVSSATSPATTLRCNAQRNGTQSAPINETTSGNGDGDAAVHSEQDVRSDSRHYPSPCTDQDLIPQGLSAPLRTIELQPNTHVSTENNLSTKKNKDSLAVEVGEAAQLDLIAPDPVPLHSQDKEIEVSRFFAAKEEQKWKDLEKNGEWLHAMVTAHPDTAFILRELANYYQWWIENPKKRRENLAASIGHWLRNEARRQRGSNGNNRAKSLPVPTEPGKYDGIGVTYSAFEE